jgi:hypothetical protein
MIETSRTLRLYNASRFPLPALSAMLSLFSPAAGGLSTLKLDDFGIWRALRPIDNGVARTSHGITTRSGCVVRPVSGGTFELRTQLANHVPQSGSCAFASASAAALMVHWRSQWHTVLSGVAVKFEGLHVVAAQQSSAERFPRTATIHPNGSKASRKIRAFEQCGSSDAAFHLYGSQLIPASRFDLEPRDSPP